ncbi:hypothetical protein [Streptomyces swartbergensis]|uniref:hypothetical protein n=1 Tax=Streptomyces swartbergensis TaxID=487165 RepID=UPI0037F9295A
MDRLLHHELRAVFSVLAVVAVSVTAAGLAHGFVPPEPGKVALYLAGLLAFAAVWTLLKGTRLRGVSWIRDYDRAVPVEDTGVVVPAGASLRDGWFNWPVLVLFLLFVLPISVFWEPWVIGIALWSALDWLGQAALVAHWERRNGLLLWRGHVASRPWELSVSRRPPTRTATGARPA